MPSYFKAHDKLYRLLPKRIKIIKGLKRLITIENITMKYFF